MYFQKHHHQISVSVSYDLQKSSINSCFGVLMQPNQHNNGKRHYDNNEGFMTMLLMIFVCYVKWTQVCI